MKKLNSKNLLIITVYIILLIGIYYSLYAYSHESLKRMDYKLRDDFIHLNILPIVSFIIPIFIIFLYIIFRKRIKEKLNLSNMFHSISLLAIIYSIIGTSYNLVISSLLEKGTIGYCNPDLEPIPLGLLGPCFLPGLDYSFLMIYLFVPLFLIIIFEFLFFIHKKIFKIEKLNLRDIVVVLLYFIVICLVTWFIAYIVMLV